MAHVIKKVQYEKFIKHINKQPKEFRVCLRCDRKFLSMHKFNRMCEGCITKNTFS